MCVCVCVWGGGGGGGGEMWEGGSEEGKWVSVHWIVICFQLVVIPKAQLPYVELLQNSLHSRFLTLTLAYSATVLPNSTGPSPTLHYSKIHVQNLCMDSILLCPIPKWVYRDSTKLYALLKMALLLYIKTLFYLIY